MVFIPGLGKGTLLRLPFAARAAHLTAEEAESLVLAGKVRDAKRLGRHDWLVPPVALREAAAKEVARCR